MQYDNTNKGIIGKNNKKETDTHPDITGSINVEGKDYWINGWKKERNDGSGSFYSLSVKEKVQRQEPMGYSKPDLSNEPDLEDDEILF